MNLSVIARCPGTGQLGIALAGASLAAGGALEGAVRPRIGAVLIHGTPSLRLNRLGMSLLAQGHAPAYVLEALTQDDPHAGRRHVVVLAGDGTLACRKGDLLGGWCDVRPGPGFAVACDGAADGRAIDALAAGMAAQAGEELDVRLLRALEAGACELPEGALSSAALCVWGSNAYSDTDLRVDMNARPVPELRRVYEEFKPSAAYYEERARHPRNALNAREFAGILAEKRKQAS